MASGAVSWDDRPMHGSVRYLCEIVEDTRWRFMAARTPRRMDIAGEWSVIDRMLGFAGRKGSPGIECVWLAVDDGTVPIPKGFV